MSVYRDTSVDDLWIIASEDPSIEVFQELLDRLSQAEAFSADFGERLELLLENTGDDGEDGAHFDDALAGFLIDLAGIGAPDSPNLRKALAAAIRQQLPPYLALNPSLLRGLGVRDAQVPLPLLAARFAALQHLKDGTVLFLANTGRWGTVSSPVSPTGSVGITTLPKGEMLSIPLATVLDNAWSFAPGPEALKLADNRVKPSFSANDYRQIARRQALRELSDGQLKQMAQATFTPAPFSADDFNKWWEAATVTGKNTALRRACDGRSLKEISILLDGELAADAPPLSDEEARRFGAFFDNLKEAVAERETKLLAEVIAKVALRAQPDQLEIIFPALVDKAPFWPSDLSLANPAELNAWGEISSKHLPALAAATRAVFDDTFLAAYAVRLPQRALTPLCDGLDTEVLYDTFSSVRFAGGDFMIWLWKNRKKAHIPDEVLAVVNIENVVRALNQDGLPKAWAAGQRDLRSHLLDKADFQQHMIDAAGGVASALISSLHGANFFAAGERQSLLAKFARLSPEVKAHLEGGAGEQMMASAKENQGQPASMTVEPLYTSMASFRRRSRELDDIINIHQPENREALKTARAHGDFRENSEFDAAKERRNYLSRRRHELENELLRVQAVDFANVTVEDSAVIGCSVELEFKDGSRETYYLLGAWDGDPDRNRLSYKTRLGESIYGKKTGSEFTIVGDRVCTLVKVAPLPPELLEELK